MPIRYSRNVSTVSSGSQEPVALNAFSPRAPPSRRSVLPCLAAAASMTDLRGGPDVDTGAVALDVGDDRLVGHGERAVGLLRDLVAMFPGHSTSRRPRPTAGGAPLHSVPSTLPVGVERIPQRGDEHAGLFGPATVEEATDERAADDDTVATGRGLRGLGRCRDADAEQHGQVGHRLAVAGPSARRARRASRVRR